MNRAERRKLASGSYKAKVRNHKLQLERDRVIKEGRKIRDANFRKKVEERRAKKAQ